MPKKQVAFGDSSRSRIRDLFLKDEDLKSVRPVCLGTSLREIQERVLTYSPFIAQVKKEDNLIEDLPTLAKRAQEFDSGLVAAVPQSDNSCIVHFTKLVEFGKRVKFFPSQAKKGKIYAPRMLIDLSGETIAACSSVRVNTGYAIENRQLDYRYQIIEGEGGPRRRPDSKFQEQQPKFVIIPKVFACKDTEGVFLPSVYVHDADDTGLFTVNFFTNTGNVKKVYIVFQAFQAVQHSKALYLRNYETGDICRDVFKNKDSKQGRLVKNAKVKILFGTAIDDEHFFSMKTFDPKNTQSRLTNRQLLVVDKESLNGTAVIMSARRREWHDAQLITAPGLVSDRTETLLPKVAKVGEFSNNTHCFSFLEKQLKLISVEEKKPADLNGFRILNGSFQDHPDYDDTIKAMRQIVQAVAGIRDFVSDCFEMHSQHPELPLDKLLLYADYNHGLPNKYNNDVAEKITTKSEEEMYIEKKTPGHAYSRNLYNGMIILLNIYK